MSSLLQIKDVSKSFPGVKALRSVSLDVEEGEVLALMGENGAGKSTLIKTIAGVHRPDAGRIYWNGGPVDFRKPTASQEAGISVIYQEFNLVPAMTVRENLFLGKERGMLRFAGRRRESEAAQKALQRVGMDMNLDARVRSLTVAEQQAIEIARALLTEAKLVIMDEPTAALSHHEVKQLFQIIRDLKSSGVSVIYVSHRLDEVFQISDRIAVMRDGEMVGTSATKDTTRAQLIRMMVGREVENEFPKVPAKTGATVLKVADLSRGSRVRGVSFIARAGEVLGLAGLVGAGRTETVRLIAGVDPCDGGRIEIDGRAMRFSSPRDALRAGVCLLPEDRKAEGLILEHSIRDNFALPNLGEFQSGGFVKNGQLASALDRHSASLSIRMADPRQKAKNLSGGNQQKVVLAKWLQRNTRVIIFDEPTRGVDVGAKVEIYNIMNRLAAEGKAIIMISSELPEVLGMADRIIVMHEGTVKGEIERPAEAIQEDILQMAIGG